MKTAALFLKLLYAKAKRLDCNRKIWELNTGSKKFSKLCRIYSSSYSKIEIIPGTEEWSSI
jgi:hypothetical protein